MSDNDSDLGAFLAGFVIGGLVGAATALILAPQSGEETRAQIAYKSEELRRAGEERVHHYRELADQVAHEYRDKAEELIADTRERVQETGDRVQEQARIVLDTGKERATQVKEQVNTYVQQDDKTEGSASASG